MQLITPMSIYTIEVEFPSPLTGLPILELVTCVAQEGLSQYPIGVKNELTDFGYSLQKRLWERLGNVSVRWHVKKVTPTEFRGTFVSI